MLRDQFIQACEAPVTFPLASPGLVIPVGPGPAPVPPAPAAPAVPGAPDFRTLLATVFNYLKTQVLSQALTPALVESTITEATALFDEFIAPLQIPGIPPILQIPTHQILRNMIAPAIHQFAALLGAGAAPGLAPESTAG